MMGGVQTVDSRSQDGAAACPPTGAPRNTSFPCPPWKRVDRQGRPTWLPHTVGARWASVGGLYIEPRTATRPGGVFALGSGPSLLPALPPAGMVAHHSFGRPRLQDTAPTRVEYVAWLVDCTGCTQGQAARAMYPDRDLEAAKRKCVRDRDAGRLRKHEQGVLPWFAWPDGKVPAEWWRQPEFAKAVDRWQRLAGGHLGPPLPDPLDPLTLQQQALQRQFARSIATLPNLIDKAISDAQRVITREAVASIVPWHYEDEDELAA